MANKALLGVIAGLIIVGTFASFETLAGLYPDEFLATSTVTAEPAATDASAEMCVPSKPSSTYPSESFCLITSLEPA